jgi:uncharacterized protein YqgV (UPF0045/DUF77 family)
MKATAELQVIPVGKGVSVRREIARVVELLKGYKFIVETHASGTNIEGACSGNARNNRILKAIAIYEA